MAISPDLEELLPDFLAEAQDIIEKLNADLDQISENGDWASKVDSIARGIHTIKGGCGMFGFEQSKKIAHELESSVLQKKSAPETLNEGDLLRIRKDVQCIEGLLKTREQGESSAEPSQAVAPQAPIKMGPADPHERRDTGSAPPAVDDYVRVPVKRLNETLGAISEVFLIRNQLVYLVEQLKSGRQEQREFIQSWELLDSEMRRTIGEIERSAMSMRMMSARGLFTRMSRVVQNYTAECGKKIEFVTEGDGTELDKKVLDALGEPLIHLIRNAMDHGIERSEDRLAAGKPETGRITLSASVLGNEVLIKVRDDGRGIDAKRIIESAKRKGLDVSHVTQESAAIELIFLPGFSTAEAVTDISGRGVGMDAVRTSIIGMGGQIAIETEVGSGTEFIIRLPVSMSVVPSLLVTIGGVRYAVPNHQIQETAVLPAIRIQKNDGECFVELRKQFLPVLDPSSLLRRAPDADVFGSDASIIIFKARQVLRALRVSAIERNTEIVVKPMPAFCPQIPFVSGVSVLPTGEAIFILSLTHLLDWASARARQEDERSSVHEAA